MLRPIVISVFLLSACALSYEILLMRLFSVIQWHHFAYMIIGLALLGYGISGTVVSIFQRSLQRYFAPVYISSIILFAGSSISCFLLAQQIPFNAEEILWDRQQLWYLGSLFVLLTIPFFFAATAICLALMHFQRFTAQVYAADLVGAGMGSVGVIGLLFWVFPQHALLAIAVIAMFAALSAVPLLSKNTRITAVAAIVIIAAGGVSGGQYIELKLSPYKNLQQLMRITGNTLIDERSSPLGMLSVVQSKQIPLRHAPGLSLNAPHEPLQQMALFTDGGSMTAINRFPRSIEDLSFLDYMTSALAYHLSKLQTVLVVGGGGGSGILQAIYNQVADIDVLEMNPQVIELVDETFGVFSGKVYSREGVNAHAMEVRDYLTGSQQNFELIQIALMDAFNSTSSGLHALHESYLFTTEAMQLYLRHLKPGGYLSVTRWVNLPPRDSLKLLNTAIVALQQSGIEDAGSQLLLIRGWQTNTLLVKNGRFTEQEINNAREFCRLRSFDVAWFPGISSDEVNRYNRLESPVFLNAALKLLSGTSADYIKNYKFDLQPATDNQPYFHHFFKWETFLELFQLREQGGMSLIEWGYLILLTTLLIALLSSIFLILLPLWFFYRKQQQSQLIRRVDVVFFFFAIGIAFLMIEIAFMQKFILLLHHPIYSIATTLTVFLVFAGLGSQASGYLVRRHGAKTVLLVSVAGILFISLSYLYLLDPLFRAFSDTGMMNRILLTTLLISPLAFMMGIPFPLALGSLAKHAVTFIPWAWGINGCASVISASLATILAINFGFNLVIVIALVLYLTILKTFPVPQN